MTRRIVHGLPITPARLLPQLRGGSFCVSFADPRQLEAAIELVGKDEMLLLDNGAFTAWRRGSPVEDWSGFYAWANEIMERVPNAIAVIPDVIGGTEAENRALVIEALRELDYPERAMPVWHMDESADWLSRLAAIFNFIAFGSCGAYDVGKSKAAYLTKAGHAWAILGMVDARYGRRPWVHLMRGIAMLPFIGADSADSTNIARNHWTKRGRFESVREMADRIRAKVEGMPAPAPAPLFESKS